VWSLYGQRVALFVRYDANDSLRYFAEKVAECTQASGDSENHMDALSVLGVTYLRENEYETALTYFREYQDEAIALGDSNIQAQALVNMATTYTRLDSLTKAMQLLMSSARIFEAQQDSSMLVYVYTNLGIVMGKIRNREKQLLFSKKAFAFGGGIIKDKRTLTMACNLSVNYVNSDMLDSAEALGLKVLEKSREFGNTKTLTQALTNLANLSNRQNKPKKAIEYANEVLEYEGILKHNQTFSSIYIYKGMADRELGHLNEAITSFEKALTYAESGKSLQRSEIALKHLQRAYSEVGRYEEAYKTLVRFKTASDTLASEENIRILNDLDTKYQTEKKEQQLREMDQENRLNELKIRQRNIWIAVLLVIAILVSGIIYFISRQRYLKEQQSALENRLVSLRVQLNPHFIFNALTAVQNYMLSGKDLRQATRYLSNFAKVMRAFLEFNQEETVSLDKEMYAIELYMGIQKLRFSDGFDFKIELDDDLIPEETMVPPMMLQPFLENAIEHGIRNIDNGLISLGYHLDGNQLIMSVSDNGIGRQDAARTNSKVAEKTSLATKITKERIALLNRREKGKYSFEINDVNANGTGTIVTFTIPYTAT